MKNELEELKKVADQLLINSDLALVKIDLLEQAIFEIADHLELSTLKSSYYHTLMTENNSRYADLGQILFEPKKAVQHQFEFESSLRKFLSELK